MLASVKVEFGDELFVFILEVLSDLLLSREPAASASSVIVHIYSSWAIKTYHFIFHYNSHNFRWLFLDFLYQ